MRILMVCLGNICRSPMAEGVMRDLAKKTGKKIEVDSAGTSNYHIGESPDERAIKKSKEYKIDISNLRGRQFQSKDFDEFDLILAMDTHNYNDILKKARNEEDEKKVEMILNYSFPNENRSVPDPYYGGEDGFENVYRLLMDACEKILQEIE